MSTKALTRLAMGALIALPLLFFSISLARAKNPTIDINAPLGVTTECVRCHSDVYDPWKESAHSDALIDPAFQEAWAAEDKPERCLTCHTTGFDYNTGKYTEDGVSCTACHSPISADHPDEPMPVDRTTKLCGSCHNETTSAWRESEHHNQGMDCVTCHNPHDTSLKADTTSELCATCHEQRVTDYTHTTHSGEGLLCTDCHLGGIEVPDKAHTARDHSFTVSIAACTKCHEDQMHTSAEAEAIVPVPEPLDAMSAVEDTHVSVQPEPASPVGFAALTIVVGFGAGIVLAPWFERWYRRNHKH